MAELKKRLKKGDRWFLALVDPLLEKPVYFAMRQSDVSVGFHPEDDWQLPTDEMGLDVIGDSLRLGPDVRTAAPRRKFFQWPWRGGFCDDSSYAPSFRLKFDPTSHGEGCWSVSCALDQSCRVEEIEARLSDPLWSEDSMNNVNWPELNPESEVSGLSDGDVFEFIWPYYRYDNARKDSIYDIPPQRLSFVFIEELAGAKRKDNLKSLKDPKTGGVTLMSLPRSVLAQIASYLEPEEFLKTLAVVSRVFTSPILKGCIPWKTLKLDNTFDAYRVPEMASPEAVRHVKCYKPWSISQRSEIYLKWKPLIKQDSLVSLEVRDHQLLRTMGVPPNLKELSIVIEDDVKDFVQCLEWIRFPNTIKKLSISFKTDRAEEFKLRSDGEDDDRWANNRGSSEDESDEASSEKSDEEELYEPGENINPVWLFRAFKSLEKLQLDDVPMVKDNWKLVPEEQLAKIDHVALKGVDGFPLSRFKNLVRLELDLGLNEIIAMEVVWDRVESLVLHTCELDDAQLLRILKKTPNLVALQLASCGISTDTFNRLSALVPHLRVVDLDFIVGGLAGLATPITNNPNIDVVRIKTDVGSVKGVSRDAFPTGDEGSVEWSARHQQQVRSGQSDCSFLFSRLSRHDCEALLIKYRSDLVGQCDPD